MESCWQHLCGPPSNIHHWEATCSPFLSSLKQAEFQSWSYRTSSSAGIISHFQLPWMSLVLLALSHSQLLPGAPKQVVNEGKHVTADSVCPVILTSWYIWLLERTSGRRQQPQVQSSIVCTGGIIWFSPKCAKHFQTPVNVIQHFTNTSWRTQSCYLTTLASFAGSSCCGRSRAGLTLSPSDTHSRPALTKGSATLKVCPVILRRWEIPTLLHPLNSNTQSWKNFPFKIKKRKKREIEFLRKRFAKLISCCWSSAVAFCHLWKKEVINSATKDVTWN